jgi:acyl-CoA reductase-like NAD-dependent aldehyde dehydrogenase
MPYGGVKESGIGREGLKYAIEEMTDIKMVVFNLQKVI